MKFFIIAVAVVLLLLAVLLFSPLKINAEYRNRKLRLTFQCAFIRFSISDSAFRKKRKNKKDKPQKDVRMEKPSEFEKLKNKYGGAKAVLTEIIKNAENRVRFSDIYIRIRYGTGDASSTGILYGGIWSLVGNAYAYLCRHFYIQFPNVELEPVFDGKAFEIELQGIITTRLVHIIICVLKLIRKGKAD